jgi:phosphate transport system permease protein
MMTPPPDERGGLLNAFFGSALISVLAIAIGTPVGVLAGTFLAEYANHTSWAPHPLHQRHPAVGALDRAGPVRVRAGGGADGHFSAFAGAIALAFIACR